MCESGNKKKKKKKQEEGRVWNTAVHDVCPRNVPERLPFTFLTCCSIQYGVQCIMHEKTDKKKSNVQ